MEQGGPSGGLFSQGCRNKMQAANECPPGSSLLVLTSVGVSVCACVPANAQRGAQAPLGQAHLPPPGKLLSQRPCRASPGELADWVAPREGGSGGGWGSKTQVCWGCTSWAPRQNKGLLFQSLLLGSTFCFLLF